MITETRTKEYKIYIASDGTEFESESACRRYEVELSATAVYVIRTKLGYDVYSSEELADQARKCFTTPPPWVKVFVDKEVPLNEARLNPSLKIHP